jgi:hypothetical protein
VKRGSGAAGNGWSDDDERSTKHRDGARRWGSVNLHQLDGDLAECPEQCCCVLKDDDFVTVLFHSQTFE